MVPDVREMNPGYFSPTSLTKRVRISTILASIFVFDKGWWNRETVFTGHRISAIKDLGGHEMILIFFYKDYLLYVILVYSK